MKNPLDADAKAYIDANVDAEFQGFAWKIAKHESKQGSRVYNQFNSGEGNNALPNFGTPSGWGMCQIDKGANNCHTAILYDWHVNVAEMNDKLRRGEDDCFHRLLQGFVRSTGKLDGTAADHLGRRNRLSVPLGGADNLQRNGRHSRSNDTDTFESVL